MKNVFTKKEIKRITIFSLLNVFSVLALLGFIRLEGGSPLLLQAIFGFQLKPTNWLLIVASFNLISMLLYMLLASCSVSIKGQIIIVSIVLFFVFAFTIPT